MESPFWPLEVSNFFSEVSFLSGKGEANHGFLLASSGGFIKSSRAASEALSKAKVHRNEVMPFPSSFKSDPLC